MTSPYVPETRRLPEAFRSWGETQIARMLDRYGMPYHYEHPVVVVDSGKTRVWYPDFQLRGQGILIEYCGRYRDSVYAEGMARKKAVYAENGLSALMFTPELFRGDWSRALMNEIEAVHQERLAFVCDCRGPPNSRGKRAAELESACRRESISGVYASGAF